MNRYFKEQNHYEFLDTTKDHAFGIVYIGCMPRPWVLIFICGWVGKFEVHGFPGFCFSDMGSQ